MSVTQYIGARYVPLFADPLTWDITKAYEALTIVYYQGNSYTSRQAVPAGIDITNDTFWALTGNYNAQIEQYRAEVQAYDGRITANTAANTTQDAQLAGTSTSGLKTLIDANTAANTAQDAQLAGTSSSGLKTLIDANTADVADIKTTLTGFDTTNQVKAYIDAECAEVYDSIRKNLTSRSEPSWGIAARHFRPAGYSSVQGFCIFEQGGIRYWAQAEINTDTDGKINIYRVDTNALVGSVSGNFGHCNGIEYIDSKLFIDSCAESGTVPYYTCISVANPASPTALVSNALISTPNTVSRLTFISENEVLFWRGGTGEVWLHNMTTGIDTPLVTLDNARIAYETTVQDMHYNASLNLYYFGLYKRSGVALYDGETGERVNVITIPEHILHTEVQEGEGAYIYDGMLYVNFRESAGELKLATLAYWDFERGTIIGSPDMRPNESVDERYLNINITNDGDLVHPTLSTFLLASDAVNLMRSQGADFTLHITIVGSRYDYTICLQDVVSYIEPPSDGVTIYGRILVLGGQCFINNAAYLTLNSSAYESAINCIQGTLTLGSLPHVVGFTNEVGCSFGAILQVVGNITFTSVVLNRAVAFVRNSTNFHLTNSLVYVQS